VHLALADLWTMAARIRGSETSGPRARAELEAAVAAALDEPVALVRLAELERDPDLRRGRAEALVQRFPDSPEARVFLARVLRDDGGPVEGRREAALAAVTAAPDSVDALTAHAIEELRSGNASGAVLSLARAEQLEPWNPAVFVARAVVLGAIGQCDQAVDSVQRALDVLPDDPPLADVRTLIQERDRISRTCRPRPGP
jgi:Flp pilus assembly protein TadD